MVIRVSKQEASARLQVSLSTVNRRIEDGELEVEYETHGRSHRVWVLLPDTADAPGDETDGIPAVPDNAAGDMAGMSEAAAVEVAILRERCARFEELSEYRGKLLVEADARTQWLIEELAASQRTTEALARALPPAPVQPVPRETRRGLLGWLRRH